MTSPPRRILVRCPNWVGDVVMATPALGALRRRFPDAEITVAIKSYAAPILDGSEFIDGRVELYGAGGPVAVWKRARTLRRRGFDLAVLLTNSFSSALEVFLAGIPRRLGYRADGRSLLLSHAVRQQFEGGRRLPLPMVDYYLALTAELGCERSARGYVLDTTAAERAELEAWSRRNGIAPDARLVGINPGAKFGSSKLWIPERFAAAADRLSSGSGRLPVLLGGPGEEPLLDAIDAAMTGPRVNSSRDLLGLGALKAMLARLDLLVTTDTGPRAMAQALEVPSVVLMGSTHPGWTDANNERSVIVRHEVPCGPCHKKICDLDHRCMTEITVEEVVAAAERLLSDGSA